jgi:hypothetical protein
MASFANPSKARTGRDPPDPADEKRRTGTPSLRFGQVPLWCSATTCCRENPIKDIFQALCHPCREHGWGGVMLAGSRGFCYNLASGSESGMEKCFA